MPDLKPDPTARRGSNMVQCIALAKQGIPTFPCGPSKAPMVPGGFKAATTDPMAIQRMWQQGANLLIGVPTGSITGFDVLDLDLTKHPEAAAWWAANQERMPATQTHVTRAGGVHLFFKHADGIGCSAGKIAPGVDVRGDGGYVVWWPADGFPTPGAAKPAPWPEWLLAHVVRPAATPLPAIKPRAPLPTTATGRARYADAAVRAAVKRVSEAGQGGRNDALNKATFGLAALSRDGLLSHCDIADAMAGAGLAAGLTQREVIATIASALAAGTAL